MSDLRGFPGVSEAMVGRSNILADRYKKSKAAKTIQRKQRKRSEAKKRTRAATTIQRKQRKRSAAKRSKLSRSGSRSRRSSGSSFEPTRQSSRRLSRSRRSSQSNTNTFTPKTMRHQLSDAKAERDRLMSLRELRQASMQPGAMPMTYQGRVPNLQRHHYDHFGRPQMTYDGYEIPEEGRLVRQNAITPQKYRENRLLSEFPPSKMG